MRQRTALFRWIALAALAAAGMIAISLLTSASPRPPAHLMAVKTDRLGEITYHPISRSARVSFTTYQPPTGIWLLRDGDGWLALANITGHPKGCTVVWNPSADKFTEPCLGSVFERSGKVIAGPAPQGLDAYSVTVQPHGWVEVDLSRPSPASRR